MRIIWWHKFAHFFEIEQTYVVTVPKLPACWHGDVDALERKKISDDFSTFASFSSRIYITVEIVFDSLFFDHQWHSPLDVDDYGFS